MTRFTPGPETSRAFRDALGQFATGVTVVTCMGPNGPLGMTANSFASLSLDPPLVLWSPARASRRFKAFEKAEHFVVQVLAEDQYMISRDFARNGQEFARVEWQESEHGAPVIAGCIAYFECRRHAVYEGGDHAIIIGEVLATVHPGGPPLIFAQGTYGSFKKHR